MCFCSTSVFRTRSACLWLLYSSMFLSSLATCHSQEKLSHGQAAPPPVREATAGDMPTDPGPVATNLSGALRSSEIHAAMKRVADWQLARVENQSIPEWTYATLYMGLLSASDTLQDARYSRRVQKIAEANQWNLGPRKLHADDQAIGQTYLQLYTKTLDPKDIEPLLKQFDEIIHVPDDPSLPMWWWCDALFMAPPIWSHLTATTHDPRYLDYMDRQWHITANSLWDPREKLFFRDKSYFLRHEKNGKSVFWSRGNGWVMAGLSRTLTDIPLADTRRRFYVEKLQAMSSTIARLQGADGLWKPGLLDEAAYPNPEVSGSSFFIYAIAWGVNHGVLDDKTYGPVIEKGWAGLVGHIYEDGRLGSIQPVGAGPSTYTLGSSYVFGTGAFLMAGSEVDRYVLQRRAAKKLLR